MEEKIGKKRRKIFIQNAKFNANCDQIRLVTKFQKRQHCLWFNGNSESNVYKNIEQK